MVPTRRFLGFPAWVWPLAAVVLVAVALLLPPPGPLAEPIQEMRMFWPPVLMIPAGDYFLPIPFDQRGDHSPVWSFSTKASQEYPMQRNWGWSEDGPGLGFFHRICRWKYTLTATRYDTPAPDEGAAPLYLPDTDVTQLRRLVIRELNQRPGTKKLGDRLKEFLDDGAEKESWLCPQNAVVLLAWLSLPLGLAALVSMFSSQRLPVRG